MTDEEYLSVYDSLVRIAQEADLGWLVAQVEAHIRLQEPGEEEIRVGGAPRQSANAPIQHSIVNMPPRQTRLSGRAERYIVTREFSIRERVDILLAAIEQATVHVVDMQQETLRFMEELGVREIGFYPDDANTIGTTLDARQVHVHQQQAEFPATSTRSTA